MTLDVLKYFLLFGISGIIYCIFNKKIGEKHTIIWFSFPFFLLFLSQKNYKEHIKLYSIQYFIRILIIITLIFLSLKNKINKRNINIILFLWILLALFQTLYFRKNKKVV